LLCLQLDNPKPVTPTPTTPLISTPVHVSTSAASLPKTVTLLEEPNVASVPVSKSKFQDLDAFLNSDTEEEEEDESEEERLVPAQSA